MLNRQGGGERHSVKVTTKLCYFYRGYWIHYKSEPLSLQCCAAFTTKVIRFHYIFVLLSLQNCATFVRLTLIIRSLLIREYRIKEYRILEKNKR